MKASPTGENLREVWGELCVNLEEKHILDRRYSKCAKPKMACGALENV